MVMDATQPQQPSPQSVGREFVRQYYTLLNKAPNHLHRFYNNNSSFIHGESTLVVGQKNIHNRIQQLNFHDCHAKISQVDAQATLGSGVVVQVTGELSNDGQPMRRFTQTFVLAAQSPKKYYVHNDIFRYQDLYSDEENEGETRSENDEDQDQLTPTTGSENQSQVSGSIAVDQQQQQVPAPVVAASSGALSQQQQVQAGAPQQQAIYYSMPSAGGRPVTVLASQQAPSVPLGPQFIAGGGAAGVSAQQVATASISQQNGVVAHEELLSGMQQPSAVQQPTIPQSGSPIMQSAAPISVATPVLAAQTTASVAAASVANVAAVQQNTPSVMQGYQQPLVQQQPLSNAVHQQAFQSQPPQTSAAIVDTDGSISPNTITFGNNEAILRSSVVMAAEVSSPIVDDFKTINEQQQQEKYEAAKHQQNEPKTYANLFKSNASPSGFVNAAMQQQQQLQQQQQQANVVYHSTSSISATSFQQSNPSSMSVYNNRNTDNPSLRSEHNMGSAQGGPLPQRPNVGRINKDFDQRRPSNTPFGDNQQLFLGNIPHHASEEELKTVFQRYGNVLELRILSKTGGKLPPGVRNPLNYGFITYENADAVQNCLSHCPLYFPDTPDGQKLNVEEKKPRMRNEMPPRQSMANPMSSNNNNMNNSQRNNIGGGPPSRSLSNTGGGMMRGGNTNTNTMSRGSSGGGPRIGGAFNRNENRNGPSNGGGPQVRGSGGNNNAQSGGGNYGGRR